MFKRMMLNTDFVQNFIGLCFTVTSMMLSGYFGWMRADAVDIPGVQWAAAVVCAMIAAALAWAVVRRERLRYEGERTRQFKSMSRMVALLAVANVFTDFMATQGVFSLSGVKAVNTNNSAALAKNEVTDLETRLKNYKAEKAFRTPYDSPAAYDQLINEQKQVTDRGRNVFKRTKGCTDTTLEISSKVCRRIDVLKANKANAMRRKVVLAEIDDIEEQLKKARRKSESNKKTVDLAAKPVNDLTKVLMFFVSPFVDMGEGTLDWGQILFVFFMAIIITVSIIGISKEQGRRLGPLPEYAGFNLERYLDDEDDRGPPAQLVAPEGHAPQPLPEPLVPQRAPPEWPMAAVPARRAERVDRVTAMEQLAEKILRERSA